MRETIRCCISCILPCGALDVIRIVHANGRVEEINHSVMAGEVLRAYPKHVLKRPPSASEELHGSGATGGGRAGIVPPNAELQKGKIYFLMPIAPPTSSDKSAAAAAAKKRRRKKLEGVSPSTGIGAASTESNNNGRSTERLLLESERYLSEILSDQKIYSTMRDHRRRGRLAVWRPHLESISEASSDNHNE